MHEVVFTDKKLKSETGVKTLDVAKRLMDYGYHPPTIYFPLGGDRRRGALMIEPTETETQETLDEFVRRDAAPSPTRRKQRSRDRQERAARHRAAPPRRDARRAPAEAALDARVGA